MFALQACIAVHTLTIRTPDGADHRLHQTDDFVALTQRQAVIIARFRDKGYRVTACGNGRVLMRKRIGIWKRTTRRIEIGITTTLTAPTWN